MAGFPAVDGDIIEASTLNNLAGGNAWYSPDTGAINAPVLTYDGDPPNFNALSNLTGSGSPYGDLSIADTTGLILSFKAAYTNDDVVRVTVNGASSTVIGSSVPLQKQGGTELAAGDIQADQMVVMIYNAAEGRFELLAGGDASGGGGDMADLTGGLLTFTGPVTMTAIEYQIAGGAGVVMPDESTYNGLVFNITSASTDAFYFLVDGVQEFVFDPIGGFGFAGAGRIASGNNIIFAAAGEGHGFTFEVDSVATFGMDAGGLYVYSGRIAYYAVGTAYVGNSEDACLSDGSLQRNVPDGCSSFESINGNTCRSVGPGLSYSKSPGSALGDSSTVPLFAQALGRGFFTVKHTDNSSTAGNTGGCQCFWDGTSVSFISTLGSGPAANYVSGSPGAGEIQITTSGTDVVAISGSSMPSDTVINCDGDFI